MDYNKIIEKYYTPGTDLYNIFMRHSRDVTRRALQIVDAHPELGADRQFVEEAAMLHDIGIVRCDAPGICCHGTEPYLRHGMIGAAMMREEGYDRHARVCERHTGAGLSAREIEQQNLFHDGGFSNMGMSLRGMTQYNKSFVDENRDENGNIIYG